MSSQTESMSMGARATIAQTERPVITLSPTQVVIGIGYHIIEANIAQTVNLPSALLAIELLGFDTKRKAVATRQWGEASNSTRLNWLLKLTGFKIVINKEGCAYFRERYGKKIGEKFN